AVRVGAPACGPTVTTGVPACTSTGAVGWGTTVVPDGVTLPVKVWARTRRTAPVASNAPDRAMSTPRVTTPDGVAVPVTWRPIVFVTAAVGEVDPDSRRDVSRVSEPLDATLPTSDSSRVRTDTTAPVGVTAPVSGRVRVFVTPPE